MESMMSPKREQEIILSIIVPVYNVKNYICRCMDSIIEQLTNNEELIVVDDGSTDGSSEICDSYKRISDRIIVIHKKNGGLSSARNSGMELARGKYIMFVDSDDYIKDNVLGEIELLLNENECDVFVGKAKTVDDKGCQKDKIQYGIKAGHYSRSAYVKELSKNRTNNTFCAQFSIYNASFVKENQLSFLEGIIHEDELWTSEVIIKATDIYFSDLFFYFHYIREGSIMHSSNREKSAESYLRVCSELKKDIERNEVEKNVKNFFEDRIAFYFFLAVGDSPIAVKSKNVNRFFPLTMAKSSYNILKSILFAISVNLYTKIHDRFYAARK